MAACVAASALPLRPAPPRAGGRVDTPTHRATRRVHARASAAEKADPAAFVCDDRGACASVDEMKEKEQNAVETRRALKEWGAVVNALAEGDQTVIFRKGGLKDGKGGFKLESRQFGLFPTVYHPKELDGTVSTEASKKFVDAKVPDMKRGEEVPISVVAEVTGAWVTHDASVLDALSDHHVWSRDVLESRLSWKPDTPITVLELRAKKLPAPRVHALPPDLEKYGGCKSWIDLPFSVPVKGEEPAPALTDDAFCERQRALRSALAEVDHAGFRECRRRGRVTQPRVLRNGEERNGSCVPGRCPVARPGGGASAGGCGFANVRRDFAIRHRLVPVCLYRVGKN